MEYFQLSNDVQIPSLGMGGWSQNEENIKDAIEIGYRLFDTAAQYENEREVGNAIIKSGIKREDFFITTKIWNDDVKVGNVRDAIKRSLDNLQTDYLDLYLIHYPVLGYENAWDIISQLYSDGIFKSIGVSNFQMHHIKTLIESGFVVPHINQVETHPYFQNQELIDYCINNNIAVEAWCPIGGPNSSARKNVRLWLIAKKYKKTISQIILRWQYQRGIITIPKSSNVAHMKDNFDIFDFNLTSKEMNTIYQLDKSRRLGIDPDKIE